MKTQTRRILFPLAGAVLGMLAGAGFGMDKGIAASAAFFGFVGFGLGYALHDFNWKRNRKTAFLKFELKTLPNVAEVATVGGMVKQYQVVLDPVKLASLPPAPRGREAAFSEHA